MFSLICKYCGKNFQSATKITYCSDDCAKSAEEVRKREYAKTKVNICAYCGKVFPQTKDKNGNYKKIKYCSDFCLRCGSSSSKYELTDEPNIYLVTPKKPKSPTYYYNRKTNEIFNFCAYCGKKTTYSKIESVKKYCSDKCGFKNYASTYEKEHPRTCAYCGKEFIVPRISNGKYSQTLFCSEQCRYLGSCRSQKKAQVKREQTCLNRYGVMYPCLTEQCRNANYNIKSNVNREFGNLLKDSNIDFSEEFIIGSYAFDFKVGENTLIEINPTYTHNVLGNHFNNWKHRPDFVLYHKNKTSYAKEHGNYRVINVWDWDDWDKILNLIKPKQKLYARKLTLLSITKQQANAFLDNYHLQNSCYGNSVNLGLYQDEQLVQIMTFGKPRYNKNYQWELLRLCTKFGYYVVGGAERLFKHFVRECNPESVISYCDMSKFSGNVYSRLGFNLLNQNKPQKIWSKNSIKITDSLLRQRGYDQLFKTNYGKGTSNEQLMIDNDWLPIYDCGQNTYLWKQIS